MPYNCHSIPHFHYTPIYEPIFRYPHSIIQDNSTFICKVGVGVYTLLLGEGIGLHLNKFTYPPYLPPSTISIVSTHHYPHLSYSTYSSISVSILFQWVYIIQLLFRVGKFCFPRDYSSTFTLHYSLFKDGMVLYIFTDFILSFHPYLSSLCFPIHL
jgi:hypothetical protein